MHKIHVSIKYETKESSGEWRCEGVDEGSVEDFFQPVKEISLI